MAVDALLSLKDEQPHLSIPQLISAVAGSAPEAVTQAAFAETLGRLLNRPARLRLPASLLRLVFGELADATLLCSTRAAPTALLKAGFDFRHPSLETALAAAVALPSGAAFGGRLRGPQSGMTKDSHPRG